MVGGEEERKKKSSKPGGWRKSPTRFAEMAVDFARRGLGGMGVAGRPCLSVRRGFLKRRLHASEDGTVTVREIFEHERR